MPLFYIPAKARHRADAATALRQLNAYIAAKDLPLDHRKVQMLDEEHAHRLHDLALAATPRDDGKLSCAHVVRAVREAIPQDAVVLIEAVTETCILLSVFFPEFVCVK